MSNKTKAIIAIVLGMVIGLVCGCNPATQIQKVETFVSVVKPSIDAVIAIVGPLYPPAALAGAAFDAAWGPLQAALDRWKVSAATNAAAANQIPAEVVTALQAIYPSLDQLVAAVPAGAKYAPEVKASVSLTIATFDAILQAKGQPLPQSVTRASSSKAVALPSNAKDYSSKMHKIWAGTPYNP